MVPLVPNTAQAKLERLIRDIQDRGLPVWIVVLKARQVGMSTWIDARLYDRAKEIPNTNGIIVAHDDSSTVMLFEKIKTYHDYDPEKVPVKYSNRRELLWKLPLRSRLSVQTAGKVQVGRSETFDAAHVSEAAFFERADDVFTALLQAIPDSPNTMVFVESTANGVGGAFHDLCQKARAGGPDCNWHFFFFAWHEEPSYRRKVAEGFRRTEEEEKLAAAYGLDDEQLSWRRWTIENRCKGSVDTFRQEYPSNPDEAFLVSGRPVFDTQALRTQLDELQAADASNKPIEGWLMEDQTTRELRFIPGRGPFLIRLPPHPKGQYVMGADVSEGQGGDPAATVVMHKRTLNDIAELHGQFDPDQHACFTDMLRRWYNNAPCCFDSTGVGQAFLQCYKKRTNRIYRKTVKNKLTNERRTELGYKLNSATRAILVAQYVEAVRTGAKKVGMVGALQEHLTFVFNDEGKPEHRSGCHDDRVFARMLALEMLRQEPYSDGQFARTIRRGVAASMRSQMEAAYAK